MNSIKAAMCSVGFLVGLAASPSSWAAEKVTFGYFPVADFLITFIAKDQGFFEQHGIDATVQLMANNATSTPAALVANSIQIGATTTPVVLQADENGLDIKIFAGSGAYYPGFHAVALVVPTDSPAKAAKDLQGMSIGLTGINNMVHILLVKWLTDEGVDPSKIHFIESNIAQMPDLLRARQIDAVVAIEPFLSRIVSSDTGRVFAYFQDFVPSATATMVWAVASDYAKSHPETIKSIRAALADALAFHQAHPEQADAVLAHYLPMPATVLKALPKPTYVNDFDPRQINFWATIMREQKLLMRAVDPSAIALP